MERIEVVGTGLPNMPADMCCNCGQTVDVEMYEAKLRVTRFLLFGGTEWSLRIALPHCRGCARSRKRIPPNLGKIFWLWALGSTVLFIAGFSGLMALEVPIKGQYVWTGLMLAGLAQVALLWAWYGTRRPVGSQTSYYQAVRVLKVNQLFSGETQGMVLGFTNQAFAERVLARQPHLRRMGTS